MINSRVALQVVTSGSIDIAGAYFSGRSFVTLMQTNCGGAPPWPLAKAAKARAAPRGRKAPAVRRSFLPKENGK
jgi:hypothetical protein